MQFEFIEEDGSSYIEFTVIDILDSIMRQSGSHNSFYDMTNGLIASVILNFANPPTFTITLDPTSWVQGDTYIIVHLEREGTFTWSSVDNDRVTAGRGGTVRLSSENSGRHRIRLHNPSGHRVTGDIRIAWAS